MSRIIIKILTAHIFNLRDKLHGSLLATRRSLPSSMWSTRVIIGSWDDGVSIRALIDTRLSTRLSPPPPPPPYRFLISARIRACWYTSNKRDFPVVVIVRGDLDRSFDGSDPSGQRPYQIPIAGEYTTTMNYNTVIASKRTCDAIAKPWYPYNNIYFGEK